MAEGTEAPVEKTAPDGAHIPENKEELQAHIEERAKQYVARQIYRVIIPSFSRWFNRDEIHEIERKSLPEFFNGKNRTKTPEVYRQYRDFMIDTYRLNPTEYLTVTACRRNLAGDIAAIMRVHRFLEQWGLLNYQIDPETRPSIVGPQYTGHFQVLLDTPRGLEPQVPAPPVQQSEGRDLPATSALLKACDNDINKVPINLELRRSVYDSGADAMALLDESQRKFNALTTRQYNCFTCGDDVTKIRYHNLQNRQAISAMAFKDGLFPSNTSAADFVKIQQIQRDHTRWTDQELLLLLEGIEMYECDWDEIAYHVGTRSREACLTKFLQLPIEDPYLVKNAALRVRERLTESASSSKIKTEREEDGSVDLEIAPVGLNSTVTSEPIVNALNAVKKAIENDTLHKLEKRAMATEAATDEAQRKLIDKLVHLQIAKIDAKLKQFTKLEQVVQMQKREIDTARQELVLDRLALNKQADQVLQTLRQAVQAKDEEAVKLAEKAVALAHQSPKLKVLQNSSDGKLQIPNPTLRPISLDTPQQYKFWSA